MKIVKDIVFIVVVAYVLIQAVAWMIQIAATCSAGQVCVG